MKREIKNFDFLFGEIGDQWDVIMWNQPKIEYT